MNFTFHCFSMRREMLSLILSCLLGFTIAFTLRASSIIGSGKSSVSLSAKSSLKTGAHLEDLPYAYNALEPHISEKTLRIHHDKHHAKYVVTTNDLIKGTDLEKLTIEDIVRESFGKNQALFNNAGQSFNHDFYWNSMSPDGGGKPTGEIATLIDRDFGSYDAFRKEFVNAALTAFGSGWAWLVATPSGLKIKQTIGANNPLTDEGSVPLLTCDVWEHAYYLDHQNLRNVYVDAWLDHLVSWEAANARLPTGTEEL